MIALVTKFGRGLVKLLALPFSAVRSKSSARGVAWVAHFLLIAAILVLLAVVNDWLELDKAVQAPSEVLRRTWLPTMFLLAYTLGWLAWWTWLAMRQPGPLSPFPDVDEAWQQAQRGLEDQGYSLAELPLVLLLGQPESNEREIISTLHVGADFGPVPSQAYAPLRVMADDRAIYVSGHGVSALSKQAEIFARTRQVRRAEAAAIAAPAQPTEKLMPAALRATAAVATAEPAGAARSGVDIGADLERAETQLSLALGETDVLGDPLWADEDVNPAKHAAATTPRTLSIHEAETSLARLGHLVRLIREARGDRLPVNGVALMTPVDAIETHAAANVVASLFSQELDTVADAAGATAPAVTVITDVDQLAGCEGLLRSLPAERRDRRLGTTISLDADAPAEKIGRDVARISTLVGSLCYRLFAADETDVEKQLHHNGQLYAFGHELAGREGNLQTLLERSLAACHEPWRLAGCYLAATGHGPEHVGGFGAGILQRLLDVSQHARWTPATLERDRRDRRLAWLCWSAVGGMAALGAVLLVTQ